jgi:integrase
MLQHCGCSHQRFRKDFADAQQWFFLDTETTGLMGGTGTYLAAASPLLHDVSLMLFDTGMRPEECHCLRWDNINWDGGRNGVLLVTQGKTKAARRVLPLSPRVRTLLENR